MGFIDTAPGTALPVFYNEVHAVGKRCPNVPDDVMLVQYLLKALYDKFPPADRPKGEMRVDGICGPITKNWIIKFQLDVSADNPGRIAVDNRIDRIRTKNFVGSISRTQYTLGFLNWNVKRHNPEAFFILPSFIPLQNPASVPPPSRDVTASNSAPIPGNTEIVPEEIGGF